MYLYNIELDWANNLFPKRPFRNLYRRQFLLQAESEPGRYIGKDARTTTTCHTATHI